MDPLTKAKLTVDKTVGSSLTVLGSCRETGVPHWGDWVTDPSTLSFKSGFKYSLATVRTVCGSSSCAPWDREH